MIENKKLCLILIAVLLCFMTAASAEDAQKPMDVKLDIMSGQVKLTRVGKTLSDVFTSGFPLFHGDIVETMRESKAELTYADGTVMRMKPLTKIEVQPNSLKVFKGQSWFKFTKRGTEFLIETPSLVAGIRGTIFDIAVTSKGKSMLSVMEGGVAVRGSKGGEVIVETGSAVNCEPGDEPGKLYKFNLDKKQKEWSETEWMSASGGDVEQFFINYLNLKAEYGPDDPRTREAQRCLEEARRNAGSQRHPADVQKKENTHPFQK
ncbi:MAG: FecR domain-containing protein [Candidatus Riflebacteria bacterium]|nr:FecR domain-containing protein [Candidatus Riflebacteria bacterium]